MTEADLLTRITVNPKIFGGKPIIRGRRVAVEHVLGLLAAGETPEAILEAYPYLEREDIQACLVFARRVVGGTQSVTTAASGKQKDHSADDHDRGHMDLTTDRPKVHVVYRHTCARGESPLCSGRFAPVPL